MSSDPTPNVISLPASQDGPTPWPLPDGRVIDPCGLAAALASLSPRQVKALGLTISGISGRPGSISSASADLQSSLESRLRARTQSLGSTLYTLTWKQWATPSGVSRFRLRASVRRTSEIGTTGLRSLPTPTSRDYRGKYGASLLAKRMEHPRGVPLSEFMQRELGRPGYLNPELVCSLMGYSAAWDACAPTGTRSSRKRPPSSSPASSTSNNSE